MAEEYLALSTSQRLIDEDDQPKQIDENLTPNVDDYFINADDAVNVDEMFEWMKSIDVLPSLAKFYCARIAEKGPIT